ncbi:MAG: ribonuclease III domain-containing protein [Thermoleophilaceae bacterium]
MATCWTKLPDDLARQAFTHASWVDHRAESYERLAFLGDVVLSLAVSTHLFPRFERYGAGRLTKVRAQAVSGASCAEVAVEAGRARAAARPGPRRRRGSSFEMLAASERVLASICEAVIGAAYLAFGIERVAPAVVAAFEEAIEGALEHPRGLQVGAPGAAGPARRARDLPDRGSEQGPAHDRRFEAVAESGGRELGRGQGRTKKGAEQEAAMQALGAEED